MKLHMFRIVPLSIIRSLLTYIQQWYTSYRFVDSCLQTCTTYTIAECTVNKLLMMDCPKHVEFMPEYICGISASSWFYYEEICCDARSHERKKTVFNYACMIGIIRLIF